MITKLNQIAQWAIGTKKRWRVAVVLAQDSNSISALLQGFKNGFIEPILIGDNKKIVQLLIEHNFNPNQFEIIDCPNDEEAAAIGVSMVKSGKADILMKGLIGTDKYLKAVLNKSDGLMIPGGVMTYAGILEIPKYHKLLIFTDPAVIPFPTYQQSHEMVRYAINMSKSLGVETPKIAMISSVEKNNPKTYPSHQTYNQLKIDAENNHFGNCVIDGPLDLFLAVDKESNTIKGCTSPIQGEADILLFPSIEACNPFYKGLMQFTGGEMAGLIRGTTHPVIVMSRSESSISKYYCLALACLLAEKEKHYSS